MRDNRNYETECCAKEPCRPYDGDSPAMGYGNSVQTPREINIQPMNYGYVVRVGCQSFAIETVDKLIENLNLYLKDPATTEKMWFSGELLK